MQATMVRARDCSSNIPGKESPRGTPGSKHAEEMDLKREYPFGTQDSVAVGSDLPSHKKTVMVEEIS
ncbi:hypothetical protein Daesc_002782 [Daldinia eschscholtzii]|uniref:Uncharacterized protein n=1 Tax=Daldinia eschscholtzii TaxID=292717 RepID=A0AAX6MSJ4_9PEZI